MDPAEIVAIRNRWQMTQEELADYMGITRMAVVRWEMPRDQPNARIPGGPALALLRMLACLPVPRAKKRGKG